LNLVGYKKEPVYCYDITKYAKQLFGDSVKYVKVILFSANSKRTNGTVVTDKEYEASAKSYIKAIETTINKQSVNGSIYTISLYGEMLIKFSNDKTIIFGRVQPNAYGESGIYFTKNDETV
jgi:predicted RNA-binding protein (virulence factor B family)